MASLLAKGTSPSNSLGGVPTSAVYGGVPVSGATVVGVPAAGRGGYNDPSVPNPYENDPGTFIGPASPTTALSAQNTPILGPPAQSTNVADFWGAPAVSGPPAPGTTLGAGLTGSGGYGGVSTQAPLPAPPQTAAPAPGTVIGPTGGYGGAGQTGVGGYGGAPAATAAVSKPLTAQGQTSTSVADNKGAMVQRLNELYDYLGRSPSDQKGWRPDWETGSNSS